jgi:hypothetical protein
VTIEDRIKDHNQNELSYLRSFLGSLQGFVRTISIEVRLSSTALTFEDKMQSVPIAKFRVEIDRGGGDAYEMLENPEAKNSSRTAEFTIAFLSAEGQRNALRGVRHLFERTFPQATVFGP